MQRGVSHYSERRKQSDPCVFELQREAYLGFKFMGFLITVRNFLTAVASCCPSNAECTLYSEKESRYKGYNLPSALLASPAVAPNFLAVAPNFLAAAIVQGLPLKFLNFFFLFGQTPLQRRISMLQ